MLAQRYLRLLATVDAPERILALTFTRRAAQEMLERVVGALEAAGTAQCPDDMNATTWQLGRDATRHLHSLGIDLKKHPSRLRIETLDAFNAWLAGQLPVIAGTGARLRMVDKPKPVYEEAARRALAHEEDGPFAVPVDRVLALNDQRWMLLVRLLSQTLASRDRWLPLLAGDLQVTGQLEAAQLERVRRHFDEDLEMLVMRTLRSGAEFIGMERLAALSVLAQRAALRVPADKSALLSWREDGSCLRLEPGDVVRWRDLARVLLTNDCEFRRSFDKNAGFPPKIADKQAMLDLLEELQRDSRVLPALIEIRSLPLPRYSDAQWERVRDVAQVMVLAAAELNQVFRERGAVDFPAVSMAALRALGTASTPTDLNLRLDYRLQHILVDEFQDTSSAQLELVKLLTAGWQRDDGRTLFCVGDPMQSIYGFRQAEVRAFLELAEEGVGDVSFDVARLNTNFRSAVPVVQWINRCFATVMPAADNRERGAIAFRPSVPAPDTATLEDCGVILHGFSDQRAESLGVADAIAQHLKRHPEWRIAVLVRARSHAALVATGLRARGIAFRAVDIELLQDRAVVRDLVMLIRALLHRGDRDAWLTVLRAPWAGLTLADLLVIARAGPVVWESLCDPVVLEQLSNDGRLRCERVCGTLSAAFRLRTHGTVARWVEQTWLALGGASCATGAHDLAHVSLVLQRLSALEESGMPDAAELTTSFADLYAEQQDQAAVEIMTIHKAKGLEFDMVVVPALDRRTSTANDQLLPVHQFSRASRDGMVMAARPGVGHEADELFDYLKYQLRDAAALEAQRLLYVACTRAKSRLYLTATMQKRVAASDDAWKPMQGNLLAVLWPAAKNDFQFIESEPHGPEQLDSPRGGPIRRVPADFSPLDDTREWAESVDTAAREEFPVFDWAGETARRVGSLVHAELQFMDLDNSSEEAIETRDAHFRRWLALHGVPAERLAEASARVRAALIAVQRDVRGRWILAKGYQDDVREHALSGHWRGAVTRVVFDRSFIDESGVRWIIDYKTSHHAGGGLEEFLDREVERYRAQLARYAQMAQLLGPQPIKVGLYFPLLRAWREWQP